MYTYTSERLEAYTKWSSAEVSIIVATKACIDRNVIRNGVPESILLSWTQGVGQSGSRWKASL